MRNLIIDITVYIILTVSKLLIICVQLCPHLSSWKPLCSVPTKNDQKPGLSVPMSQYPGFHGVFQVAYYPAFSKLGQGVNITRILQKPNHSQDTSTHVNALWKRKARDGFVSGSSHKIQITQQSDTDTQTLRILVIAASCRLLCMFFHCFICVVTACQCNMQYVDLTFSEGK